MDPTLLIGDIVEREAREKKPVEPPSASSSSTGFPQHKRRWQPSAFKQQRAARMAGETPVKAKSFSDSQDQSVRTQPQSQAFEEMEKSRIDQENQQRIQDMTPQEITQAQQDLMNGLNPALIQRLLQRANIDEPDPSSPFNLPIPGASPAPTKIPEIKVVDEAHQPSIANSEPSPQPENLPADGATNPLATKIPLISEPSEAVPKSTKKIASGYDENQAPSQIPPDLFPIADLPKSTHFPVPPSLPDLDPSDPNFLATLHEKYFPNLPADPSKLAWMAPIPSQDSPADQESPYYPHPEIGIAALRFDFRGRFLSPRISRSIPSNIGLHHHGEAPEAAGYTISELSRLARSSVPAQRCMAFQTLGRILYRLGQGEWGATVDHPIAMGVWDSIKTGRVLETLTDATMGESGHRGSRAYATEALWLYEKGGWRHKSKGR